MKTFRYILTLAFASTLTLSLTTSCMDDDDDWTVSGMTAEQAQLGNSSLQETNVVTIAQLKQMYKKQIETDHRDAGSYATIDKDMQIKAVVTANDIQGNLYNELALDDGTGAIIVSISQGGLFGYFPVGAEVLIELNGLSVGSYGKQAVIGTPYTNTSGATYASRMSSIVWKQHFKLTGNTREVTPVEFDTSWRASSSGTENCGKLVTVKNVTLKGADGTATYANAGGGSGSKSVYFNELPQSAIMLYTSNYADFASNPLPTQTVNLTGILKRYNNTWELILRSLDDVEVVE